MLEYCADLSDTSFNSYFTPNESAKSFPFHLISCGKFIAGDKYYTKRDGLANYLLFITLDGCGSLQWNGQKTLLGKDSAAQIDCRSYQEYATVPRKTWSFYYIHFNAISMEGYRSALLRELTPVTLRSPEQAHLLFLEIYKLSHQTSILSYAAQSNAISNLLTELLYSIADNTESASRLNRPDIAALAEYIKANCTKNLHTEDFTNHAKLSKHHLIRTFEQQIGMAPYKYLHMCRINKSQTLLRTTDLSVSEVAYAVGYNDPIVFIRHFKAFNTTTPGEYRKQITFFLQDTDE